MSRHILLVSYSQTGRLARLRESLLRGLSAADDVHIEHLVLQPERDFAVPWRFMDFFNTFPETVHLRPRPTAPLPWRANAMIWW